MLLLCLQHPMHRFGRCASRALWSACAGLSHLPLCVLTLGYTALPAYIMHQCAPLSGCLALLMAWQGFHVVLFLFCLTHRCVLLPALAQATPRARRDGHSS